MFNPGVNSKPDKVVETRRNQLIMFFMFIRQNTMDYIVSSPINLNIKSIKWQEYIDDDINYFVKIATSGKKVDKPLDTGRRKGGSKEEDVSMGPDDILPVMAEQIAWEKLNSHYNSLEPEYQKMLPKPEPAPVTRLTEPIHRYIDDFAEEDPLEEARDAVGLLSPKDVDDVYQNDKGTMDRIAPLYSKALPGTKDEWIPIMVRADMLRTILPVHM